MTNSKNYIIELRNATILWIAIAIITIGGFGFSYNLFSKLGIQLDEHNQKKIQTIKNIRSEGIISDQEIVKGTENEMRITTIKKLVPSIATTIGIGTSEEQKNLDTIKRITTNDSTEKEYIAWLRTSWDAQSKDNLEQLQNDIAEIIPVFPGISGIQGTENTKHITGKITLKSLIDFIQNDIVKKYNFGYAVGNIGIEGVQFSKNGSDIGAYSIPLRFDKVSNKDVIDFLDFLSKTGGITVQKKGNNQFSIKNTYTRIDKNTVKKQDPTLSQLINPLILINNLSLSPTDKDTSLDLQADQEWNISIGLSFYIRGVSSDHLIKMDQILSRNLGDTENGILHSSAQRILNICQNNIDCSEENKISDIIALLNTARDTYKSILSTDKTNSPIIRVKRRSDLMTTVLSIQKKLTQIEENINNTP